MHIFFNFANQLLIVRRVISIENLSFVSKGVFSYIIFIYNSYKWTVFCVFFKIVIHRNFSMVFHSIDLFYFKVKIITYQMMSTGKTSSELSN